MHNSKILNLLKAFSKEEFKEFGLFIESPFHNRETVQLKLYNILKPVYPEFSQTATVKQMVFKKLYPAKKYNDALMRNTLSDLLGLAEEFLKYRGLKAEAFYSQYLLLKELTNKKQQGLFKMNFKKAKKILKSSEIRDEIYYQNNFLLEDEARRNVVVNSSRILFNDDNLSEQAKSLHIQHLAENIKLYAIMLNQAKFTFDHKFDFKLLESLTEYLEKNYSLYTHIPYITIFYNCVMLYKTEDKKYFDELRSELKKHYKKLTAIDRKNMFMVLTNHSHHQINHGKFEYCREGFEIYKEFIKSGAYYEGNNFMAHYIYKGAVTRALDVKEFEWAEKFINRYKSQVHADFRESAFHDCSARLYLHTGEYEKALESLSKVQTNDFMERQNVNQTLLMIYYCKNETDSFISLVDSFRHFLKRNKSIRKKDFKLYNNFITYLKKLFTIRNSGPDKKDDLQYFRNELLKQSDIVSGKWILEKTDELLDKVSGPR